MTYNNKQFVVSHNGISAGVCELPHSAGSNNNITSDDKFRFTLQVWLSWFWNVSLLNNVSKFLFTVANLFYHRSLFTLNLALKLGAILLLSYRIFHTSTLIVLRLTLSIYIDFRTFIFMDLILSIHIVSQSFPV